MRLRFLLFFILFEYGYLSYAQMDSLRYDEKMMRKEISFSNEGSTMLLKGIVQSYTHRNFYRRPALFEYKEHTIISDYVPAFSPLAATWILKASGVESCSTMKRMALSNSLSFAIAVAVGQGLKYTVSEWRPDAKDENSFPSGHATMAFVSATILSREYGYLSPWVTIGGYSCATLTQLLRIHHNSHWMNDLSMGAGLGMVSTNLGYYLSDLIWGEEGVNRYIVGTMNQADIEAHSGLKFVVGTETISRSLEVDGCRISTSAAMSTGVDVSWFLSPYMALELVGRYSISQAKLCDEFQTFSGEQLRLYHADAALQYSYPLLPNIRPSLRILAGARYNNALHFSALSTSFSRPSFDVSSRLRPELGLGFGIDMLSEKNYTTGFSFDYLYGFTSFQPHRLSICSNWKVNF